MFLKRCRRRKCGKGHVYWQLVESHLTPRGSRHRVVAYLGELSKSERRGWARLAATLDGKAASKARQVGTPRSGPDVPARQLSLFEPPCSDDDPVPETVEVKTKGVRVERTRGFGDVFLALTLWRILGLDELFERELPEGREKVPWHLMACVLGAARFVEPSSDRREKENAMPGASAPDSGPTRCVGWKTLQAWMERSGLGRGARTVIEEFALPEPPAPGS